MKVRIRRRKAIDATESGALSDLAFLLIIFFIVIAVFNINKGFILGLPKKDSTKLINIEEIMKVQLTASNQLEYEGRILSLDEVEKAALEIVRLKPNMTFLLKVDPESGYQNVIDVVDVVRKLKIDNFSFSMSEPLSGGR